MSRKMLIDATHPEETRVVVVDGNRVEEFDFETVNKRQLAGNIYLAKVTRVEPSLQAAFVDYGGNRHGFLAFSEIHPDYYQIPVADREALKAEERALARAEQDADNGEQRARGAASAERAGSDPVRSAQAPAPAGMEVIEPESTVETDDAGEEGPQAGVAGESAEAQGSDEPADGEAGALASDLQAGADAATVADAVPGEGEGDRGAPEGDGSDADDSRPTEIESVAADDVSDEISPPRRPRRQKYKIQEVIKVRQILLVQVLKEERGNKGAALTTYLSLAGRYCVLMPNTARGGGISRKITQVADRKKLKEIASELEVPEGAGLIIRTAGARRTRAEIQRDYEYLMRLWEEVRQLTLRSIAPAPIYQEGDLIKRTIRDLYTRDIDEVLVEGEAGYRSARDFMRMIMPDHARQVKRYDEPMPLFARYQVESFLAGMFNPVVQLKSGGYIVIGVTEALVAIDVNSGRATKEGSIEETALKTNLEAADEIARQLRLRDLAGLIVIDFIDMEERRNNASVEKRLKERLKSDRARIQVGRISGFGLMEMSRQRLHPGMLESTTQPCPHCHGTGLIRSDDSLALTILRAIEEEGTRKRSREVLLKAPTGIVNYLINHKREHVALIESRYGMAVRIEADPGLVSPDFSIDRFKTATRSLPQASAAISGHAGLMDAPGHDDGEEVVTVDILAEEAGADEDARVAEPQAAVEETDVPDRRKKRRRRRRRPAQEATGAAAEGALRGEGVAEAADAGANADAPADAHASSGGAGETVAGEDDAGSDAIAPVGDGAALQPATEESAVPTEEVPVAEARPKRTRKPRAKAVDAETSTPDAATDGRAGAKDEGPATPKPRRARAPAKARASGPVAADEAAPEAARTDAGPSSRPAIGHEDEAAPIAEASAPAPADAGAAVSATAPSQPSAGNAVDGTSAAGAADATAPSLDEPAAVADDGVPPRPRRRGWWSRAG